MLFCSLLLSLFLSHAPSFCHTPPPFSYKLLHFLIPLAGLPLPESFWDIFPSPIGFPFILILKQDFWGVFVLFKLSYTYSMWQGLGGELLINAEVAVSMILILSGSFLRYSQWEWYLGLQKGNWFSGITLLYYLRSPMFVSSDESLMLVAYPELIGNHLWEHFPL